MVLIRQNWLYLGKLVVFGQNCLNLGNIVPIWEKLFPSGQHSSVFANWFYLVKMVVFRKNGYIWRNWLYLGKIGCTWAKLV